MAEVKTAPVVAQHIADEASFEDEYEMGRAAGSFRIEGDYFWYCCPCGCRQIGALRVGIGHKPPHTAEDRATWEWNGSLDAPTLSPSVHHVRHWHGWLKDGVWTSC